jgi:hypothetical protein
LAKSRLKLPAASRVKGASVEEMLMSKIKLTFVAAALSGGLLALAPMSGAFATPINATSIGKSASAISPLTTVYYRHHRYYRHRYYGHRYYRPYGYGYRPYYYRPYYYGW